MKKYLIYTDVHFCQYSSIVRKRGQKYSVRLHNLIDSISWAEHLADSENCDAVLTLGDFFDRPDLNAEEITALQDVYFSSKPHIFLTGNHEANVASLDFSTAQIFKSFEAEVVSDIKVEEINDKVDFYYIPYLTNDSREPLTNYLINNNKKKVIFSHNDLAGIQYGKFKSTSGFDVDEIVNNCTLFINGHLHNNGVINNKIILVGNLTGQNFNEDALLYDHCAYIITVNDDGGIELDKRVNPKALNFYKILINNKQDLDSLDYLKPNAVLSITCDSNLISEVTEKLANMDIVVDHRLFAMYNKNNIIVDKQDFKVEDHLQLFIDYIKTKIEPSSILNEEISYLLGSN